MYRHSLPRSIALVVPHSPTHPLVTLDDRLAKFLGADASRLGIPLLCRGVAMSTMASQAKWLQQLGAR
jgi:hypothetical protein